MTDHPHLLIVDDDREIRSLLGQYLEKNDFRTTAVPDAREARRVMERAAIDLIVLDLMLPGEDGLTLCRELRRHSQVPIIMLTARGEDVDRIVGLEVGADDYLAKPFNPRELLARIRALLRRSDTPRASLETTKQSSYRFGDFLLNIDTHDLHRNGMNVPLTAGEFNLLHVFVEHPNRVLSRDIIMDLLKGYERSPFDRSIDVQVTRLRRKIEDDPNSPMYIRTVWGTGYLFALGGNSQ